MKFLLLASALLSCACSAVPPSSGSGPIPSQGSAPAPEARAPGGWQTGEVVVQGFVGWTSLSKFALDGQDGSSVDGTDGDMDEYPLIGGGGQFKLGGDGIDWGVEALFSFSARANASATVVSGGGTSSELSVDLLSVDIFAGPFVSTNLGDKLRLYAGAGPLLKWMHYDQSGTSFGASENGFGAGLYARTGLELILPSQTMLGFGVLWSESSTNLSGELGDLDLEGVQYLITVSRGF
jgi:hypothetical protein